MGLDQPVPHPQQLVLRIAALAADLDNGQLARLGQVQCSQVADQASTVGSAAEHEVSHGEHPRSSAPPAQRNPRTASHPDRIATAFRNWFAALALFGADAGVTGDLGKRLLAALLNEDVGVVA